MDIEFKNLPITILKEDDMYVLVCYPLNISGYGTTLDEAKQSFNMIFQETIAYLVENGTLLEDLNEHGFSLQDNVVYPPSNSHLIGQENLDLQLTTTSA